MWSTSSGATTPCTRRSSSRSAALTTSDQPSGPRPCGWGSDRRRPVLRDRGVERPQPIRHNRAVALPTVPVREDDHVDRGVVHKVARLLDCFHRATRAPRLLRARAPVGAEQGNRAPARRRARRPKASSTARPTVPARHQALRARARGAGSPVLREAAFPYLADLFVLGGETVHLAVRDGDEVMYLERLVGHRSTATPSTGRWSVPVALHRDRQGAAHLRAGRRVAACARERPRALTPYTIVVPRLLREQMAGVRGERRGARTGRDPDQLLECRRAGVLVARCLRGRDLRHGSRRPRRLGAVRRARALERSLVVARVAGAPARRSHPSRTGPLRRPARASVSRRGTPGHASANSCGM